jgi:hypothetical protein
MSSETLVQVIERASRDARFRSELERSPASALAVYGLTEEERAALRVAASEALRGLAVDTRVSKLDGPTIPGSDQPSVP